MTSAFKASTLLSSSHLWISLVIVFAAQNVVTINTGSIIHQGDLALSKRPSEFLYGHFGRDPSCSVQGKRISHGHIYAQSTCLKKRCFMGILYMESEGCKDLDGLCHRVGSRWQKKCITYTCSKTKSRDMSYYQTIIDDVLCQDRYGGCHQPGQSFQFEPGKDRCQCSVKRDRIVYRCLKSL